MKKNKKGVKPILKSFNCPSCGATLDITAVGVTISVACKSCGAIIDAKDPNYRILEQARKVPRPDFHIPIGQRGTLSGNIYECIGALEKVDNIYYWREYLLFNPYIGFRWLMEMNGHWSFFKPIHANLNVNTYESTLRYKTNNYQLFNRGEGKVSYVEGEFYWRVKVGDKSKLTDYIAPPYMISLDKSENEVHWSLGRYIEPERIKNAFKLKKVPRAYGVAPNQVSDLKNKFKESIKIAIFGIFALFIIYSIDSNSKTNLTVFSKAFEYKRNSPVEEIKTETFSIKEDNKNLYMNVFADIKNSWIYLDTLLVNSETGKGIPLHQEISYYTGSDWVEGGRRGSVDVSHVPAGNYFLSIKPKAKKNYRTFNYSIELVSDVVVTSNLIWSLIAVLLIPFLVYMQFRGFEEKRWSNSSEYSED